MRRSLLYGLLFLPVAAVASPCQSVVGASSGQEHEAYVMEAPVAIPYDLLPERCLDGELDVQKVMERLARGREVSVKRNVRNGEGATEPLKLTVTAYGQLQDALAKAGTAEADSVMVAGPLDPTDLKALYTWVMERSGVDVLNLDAATLKDNELPDNAFYDPSQFEESRWFPVRRLMLPEGVERIGKAALAYMRAEQVNIPSTVREIGSSAFAYDRWLDCALVIPEGVEAIASQTFIDCFRMESAPQLPSTLRTIGDFAFAYANWPEIVLPEGLESIGQGAFTGCGLEKLEIPGACLSIGEVALQGCQELSEVQLPTLLEEIPYGMLGNCYSLRTVTLPAGCKTIGMAAFLGTPLEEVAFGNMVETIGKDAFLGCRLKTVCLPASLRELGPSCFRENYWESVYCMAKVPPVCEDTEERPGNPFWSDAYPSAATLYVPEGAAEAYASAVGWKDFKTMEETDFRGVRPEAVNYFGIEGVKWTVEERTDGQPGQLIPYHEISMEGRFTMAGRDCLLMVRTEDVPVAYIATEGEKVYFLDTMEEEWLLMYDFGLLPGESTVVSGANGLMLVNHSEHPEYVVECVSVEPIAGSWLEIMTLRMWPYDMNGGLEDFTHEVRWIRGLGSTVSPCDNDAPFRGIDDTFVAEVMLDGEVIYSGDLAKVGSVTAASEGPSAIYDMLGRRVAEPVAGGIYVRDGRKVIWK